MNSIFDRYLGKFFSGQPGSARREFSRMVSRGMSDDQIKSSYPTLSYDSINLMRLALHVDEESRRVNLNSAAAARQNTGGSFNIVGKFRATEDNGTIIEYKKGDVVYYENKTFVATRDTSGFSPRHENGGWKPVSLDNVIDGDVF